jgi:hypothetical protein
MGNVFAELLFFHWTNMNTESFSSRLLGVLPKRTGIAYGSFVFLACIAAIFSICETYNVTGSTGTWLTSTTLLTRDRNKTINDHDEDKNADAIQFMKVTSSSSCIWAPNKTQHCFDAISNHMRASLNASRTVFVSQKFDNATIDNQRNHYVHRRWLFLGDSTTYRLFVNTPIANYLMNESVVVLQEQRRQTKCTNPFYQPLQCTSIYCERCNRMEQLQLSRLPVIHSWKIPKFHNAEGPIAYGESNPYCTDCSGCDTMLSTCTLDDSGGNNLNALVDTCRTDSSPYIHNNSTGKDTGTGVSPSTTYTGPAYGGFLTVEFARDVELQTELYSTTQENLLSNYIANNWNAPIEMIHEFGRPICIASAGLHDMSIQNVAKAVYIQNVQWYLNILSSQCDYIIWLANTCPLSNNYAQTDDKTYEWNVAVWDVLLSSEYPFGYKSFYLEVFNSSISFDHEDNVHMGKNWYELLASLLMSLMKVDLGSYEK